MHGANTVLYTFSPCCVFEVVSSTFIRQQSSLHVIACTGIYHTFQVDFGVDITINYISLAFLLETQQRKFEIP